MAMTIQQRTQEKRIKAFRHAGVTEPIFLGEGAWHDAWKVSKDGHELVLRIPKEVAYGKPVVFDYDALMAEYAATKLYYQSVNRAVQGAAPNFFEFYVSAEFTYTLESFGGAPLSLHTMTKEQASQVGAQVGEIYRKTDQVRHDVEGLGYLMWTDEKKLHGSLNRDIHTLIREESTEHLADYKTLSAAYPEFKDDVVEQMLNAATALRNDQISVPSLVNQDASPENILLQENRVCLIDPYPIARHGWQFHELIRDLFCRPVTNGTLSEASI
ncbi:phosphotransferase [Exiguobacterium sp. SL-9]|uniref:phosphotransferase n=1 Tax=Exiguobacterium sp. SL-9 TaxID=2510963 RepID=UPI001F1E7C41|nr:phosphotransferase [Exiguobacterium sp. SL-9]